MDEEDFRALIEVLTAELRTVGADDIAEESHYLSDDVEDGEPRLLEPRTRLVEMLKAFDRFLAIQDHATYEEAMVRMNRILPDQGPQGAYFQPTSDTLTPHVTDLGQAPDLAEIRSHLAAFVGIVLEGGPGEATDE